MTKKYSFLPLVLWDNLQIMYWDNQSHQGGVQLGDECICYPSILGKRAPLFWGVLNAESSQNALKGFFLLKADIVKGRTTVGENIFAILFLSRRQKR